MEASDENNASFETTANDRLWAALSWIPATPLWPILAILALYLEETRHRRFIRYHAIHSIAAGLF